MPLTREDLIGHCVDRCGLDAGEIDDQTLLFTSGLLDSFNLLTLVDLVECEIGEELRISEITLDNFDSIERILRFLDSRQRAPGPADE